MAYNVNTEHIQMRHKTPEINTQMPSLIDVIKLLATLQLFFETLTNHKMHIHSMNETNWTTTTTTTMWKPPTECIAIEYSR